MAKSYFFLAAVPTHPEDAKRVTRKEGYQVLGGSKAQHEKTVAIVHDISSEFKKDPPQTIGEQRMIINDVLKKHR